jgi:DUF971 family protein
MSCVGVNLPFEFLRAVSPSASFRINKVEPQVRPAFCGVVLKLHPYIFMVFRFESDY